MRTHQGFLGAHSELVDPATLVESVISALSQFVRDLAAAPELGLDEARQQAAIEVGGRLMQEIRALPAAPAA